MTTHNLGDLLDEAKQIITGERQDAYGAPVLVAYGTDSANSLLASGIQGFIVPVRSLGKAVGAKG